MAPAEVVQHRGPVAPVEPDLAVARGLEQLTRRDAEPRQLLEQHVQLPRTARLAPQLGHLTGRPDLRVGGQTAGQLDDVAVQPDLVRPFGAALPPTAHWRGSSVGHATTLPKR